MGKVRKALCLKRRKRPEPSIIGSIIELKPAKKQVGIGLLLVGHMLLHYDVQMLEFIRERWRRQMKEHWRKFMKHVPKSPL